ncbi:beta-1,3-glucosyltransferase [Arctopsyche grandis]|uniref:beta-1,3-glucosyltransferase n=1 Tax=Arctopsyche grandis TaxID=121162 RepID=UPI00406D9EEB
MHPTGYIFVLQFALSVVALNYKEIVFVILTQPHPYHISLADRLKREIKIQAIEHQQKKPTVWVTHSHGSWIILPLLSKIAKNHSLTASWAVFCDQHTSFNLPNLLDDLSKYDPNEEIWIGRKLKDIEPTIIHHFAYSDDSEEFVYPNFASGFAMSMALIRTLHHKFQDNKTKSNIEFSIDPSFELANFVWDNGDGSKLIHSDKFCIVSERECATYPNSHDTCGKPISKDAVFFAVKTYHKFHANRVKIVKDTWGRFAKHLQFFSDKNDTSIPSIDLGIKNTERGHCAKTLGILNYLSNNLKDSEVKFVVIADDDTILSVSRLCEVLSCYGDENIALGERYGFNMLAGNGYDYLTGGGGLVLSLDLVRKLAGCDCPTPSSPDDMWLGVCLAKYKIPVIHSPLFHQARPIDYTPEYLAPHRPISFHKHWMIDPVEVYQQWFETDDIMFHNKFKTEAVSHNEL